MITYRHTNRGKYIISLAASAAAAENKTCALELVGIISDSDSKWLAYGP
jgi:hypothetical protein